MSVNYVNPEDVAPGDYYSTNLNSRIKDIDTLTDRIAMSLGYPQINIEAHTQQVYDNIAIACEFFTKFAGYTEEYLVFHSSLYEHGRGITMSSLFNYTPELSGDMTQEDVKYDKAPVHTEEVKMVNQDRVLYSFTANSSTTSPVEFLIQFKSGYYHHAVKFIITAIYNDITDEVDASVAEYGTTYTTETPKATFNVQTGGDQVEIIINSEVKGTATVTVAEFEPKKDKEITTYSRSVDDLLGKERKVVDVFSFEEGTTAGINTLFTIEQTLAQQTYFSYAMGKYGFDLISWYTLKEWLSIRSKVLSQDYYYRFNDREQRLYLTPEPVSVNRAQFWGARGVYLEKPVRDVIKELWVYQYALALTKISVARIRGKYQGTNLFGGGAPNYSELLTEGNQEKTALEEKMMNGVSPGFGDAPPPLFFVG